MAYIYNLTDTWNAVGTAFNGIKMDITNTASAAGSYMINLNTTGATTGSFTVDKSGNVAASGALTTTSVNKVTITAPATASTLTIADGKTLTSSNTLTFTGTDSSSVAFGAGGTVTYTSNKLSAFSATTSAELAGVISDETGSGKLVFATSPTFTSAAATPATFSGAAAANISVQSNDTVATTAGGAYVTLGGTNSATSGYMGFTGFVGGNLDLMNNIAAGAIRICTNGNNARITVASDGKLVFSNVYGVTVTSPRTMYIDSSGNVGGISSIRASKTNITSLSNISWLYDLSPVTFNFRKKDEAGNYTDEFDSELQYGLIAEDVETINNSLCIYTDVDGEPTLSGVHYDRLIAPLIEAVKELNTKLKAAEDRIAALEA